MIKIIHTADIHLGMENYGRTDARTGLNERLGDFLKSFDAIVDYAIENKVDLFLFAGDAFKTREPGPTYEEAFARRISRLSEAKIPTLLLVGNHDLPSSQGKANTLDIYHTLKIPHLIVSRRPEIIELEKLRIITLPWLTKAQIFKNEIPKTKSISDLNFLASERLAEKVKELLTKIDHEKPIVLTAHYSVEDSVYGAERQVMLGADIVLAKKVLGNPRFQYVALGHIHKHQIISDNPFIAYSGSIERVDFGEEKEKKGFLEINIDEKKETKIKFHILETRPFQTINIDIKEDGDTMAKIEKEIKKYDLKNAVVKVVVNVDEEKAGEVREIAIREMLKKSHFIAGISKQINKYGRLTKLEESYEDHRHFSAADLIEKFLDNKKIKPAYKLKLLSYNQKLLEEINDTA